jgi:selenocysteine lyase/cysteine desulfurase
VGFLYVSDAALARGLHPITIDMRGALWSQPGAYAPVAGARRFEQWEQAYALVLGMGAAARYALEAGVARTGQRAHALAAEARARLNEVPGVRALDRAERLSAIAAFECRGSDAADLVRGLRERGVNVSSQSRDENAVALERLGASSLLRVSPHYYNDASDLDALEAALRDLVPGGS